MKGFKLEQMTPKLVLEVKKESEYDLCEALITTEGEIFFAEHDHLSLVYDLIRIKKDLKGALRISESLLFGKQIFLSSLEKYPKQYDMAILCEDKSILKVEEDKSIKLTKPQAEMLVKYYESRRAVEGDIPPLKKILCFSENLGYSLFGMKNNVAYYSSEVANHNIGLLEEVIDENKLDIADRDDLRIYELKDKIKENIKLGQVMRGSYVM